MNGYANAICNLMAKKGGFLTYGQIFRLGGTIGISTIQTLEAVITLQYKGKISAIANKDETVFCVNAEVVE